jgi:hypothetical protein
MIGDGRSGPGGGTARRPLEETTGWKRVYAQNRPCTPLPAVLEGVDRPPHALTLTTVHRSLVTDPGSRDTMSPVRHAVPLLLLVSLAACSGPDQPDDDRSRPEDRFDVTRPGAAWLGGSLVVVSMNTPQKDEPLSWFEARFENRGTETLQVEIRTLWKDSSDREIRADDWKPFIVAPGKPLPFEGECPDPAARYVKLEVRRKP